MAECALNRVHVLFISAAVVEGGIFMSGLFIVIVLRKIPLIVFTNQ